MAASRLKRVSETTDTTVTALANRQNRTFVAQLDLVVAAGLKALGEDAAPFEQPHPAAAAAK